MVARLRPGILFYHCQNLIGCEGVCCVTLWILGCPPETVVYIVSSLVFFSCALFFSCSFPAPASSPAPTPFLPLLLPPPLHHSLPLLLPLLPFLPCFFPAPVISPKVHSIPRLSPWLHYVASESQDTICHHSRLFREHCVQLNVYESYGVFLVLVSFSEC